MEIVIWLFLKTLTNDRINGELCALRKVIFIDMFFFFCNNEITLFSYFTLPETCNYQKQALDFNT